MISFSTVKKTSRGAEQIEKILQAPLGILGFIS